MSLIVGGTAGSLHYPVNSKSWLSLNLQLQYLKELAREISDLSHEDFSLVQTAVQSHPTGSTQAHVLDLTACATSNSSSTCDGPVAGNSTSNGTVAGSKTSDGIAANNISDGTVVSSSTNEGINSSGCTADTKLISTPTGSTSFGIAAAAQLREFLDKLRQEVYYSDSGAVSDLDGSVCDGTSIRSRNSSMCADTDAAASTIPSASMGEVVEPSRGDGEPEREASISQNQIEVCQQISETFTEDTASVESSCITSIEHPEGRQEPSQAADMVDTDSQICGSQHKIADGPNCKGHQQQLEDAGDKEARSLSDSCFSQQKPKNKGPSQSKGRRGRRKKRYPRDQGVDTEDRSTVSHYGLQQHGGSRKTDTGIEREDAAILAVAAHGPSEHYHRPISVADSIATQSRTQAENTPAQAQFNRTFNYQEVVQFLRKGIIIGSCFIVTH